MPTRTFLQYAVMYFGLMGVCFVGVVCICKGLMGDAMYASTGMPTSLADVKHYAKEYSGFAGTHPMHMLIIYAVVFVFKQTFSIPGSAILNIMGGALYKQPVAFILACCLTALGASLCYLIASVMGAGMTEFMLGTEKLEQFRAEIEKEKRRKNLFWFCLSLRLFPFTPNFFLNLASGVLHVPFPYFFFSVLVGLMPYNFLTTYAGYVLSQIQSMDDVYDPKAMALLTAFSVLTVLPIWHRRRKAIQQEKSALVQ
jgi:uncharacterized membrane protein YdjX (TVP38/TMEM64 family)